MQDINSIGKQEYSADSRARRMDELVTRYEAPLLRYATRILHNPVAAQDAVQEVFIRIFRQGHDCSKDDKGLRALMFRATHNAAVDMIRRETRLRRLHHADAAERDITGPADPRCNDDDRNEAVLECLALLHPREQQVILLRIQEGLSYREISMITGRSEGNIGNIIHHAVKKLAVQLRKAGITR